MDPIDTEERRKLAEGMRTLANSLARLEAFPNNSTSSIRVDAGGAAVWMATTACLVMLGMMFVGGLWASSAFQQAAADRESLRESQETQQAYLNVLLQNSKKDEK